MPVLLRRVAWILVLACAGCGLSRPNPESLYRLACDDFRAGRLNDAAQQVEKALTSVSANQQPLVSRLQLLQADVLLGQARLDQADQVLRRISIPAQFSELHTERCLLRVNSQMKRGDMARARSVLAECRAELRSQPGASALLHKAGVMEGLLLTDERKLNDAADLLRRTAAAAAADHQTYWRAAAQINLGNLNMKRFRYDEAILSLEPAIENASACGAQTLMEWALLNASICRYRLGDFDRARTDLERARKINSVTGDRRALQANLGETANLAMFDNQPREAAPLYEKAFAIAEQIPMRDQAALWAENMAAAVIDTGQWDAAETWNNKALERYGAEIDPAPLARCQRNAAAIAAGRTRYDDAERIYASALRTAAGNPILEWEIHADTASLQAKLGRKAKARSEYELALHRIEAVRADLLRTSFQVSFLSQLIRFYQRYVEMLLRDGDTEKALAVVESSRGRILASTASAPPVVGDYRAIARKSGSVLLSWWLAPERSSLWVISPEAVHYFDLPPAAEIEELVAAHRNATRDLRDPAASEFVPSRRLFQILVGPALPYLRKNSRVTLVLDGALHGLNLETLVDGDGRYWIETATIAVAPSIGSAAVQGNVHAKARSRSLLLIGDPEQASPAFPKLKYAAEEMQAVQNALKGYSKAVYEGADAQPRVYREAKPERFSVIHFATHADANGQSPLDSSIVLSREPDGFKLYASEFAEMPISADLVTISSCRSAGARSYAGEGLVGLAWAFLHAGAHNVVAGLWDVNDESTSRLMRSMYQHMAGGMDHAAALRAAKLELIGLSGSSYRKPYYWGPFILYTSGQ